MTKTPEKTSAPALAPDPTDPLSSLHKMSITAGVASQQYVAVNSAAVIAALLGVASALTVFSPLLLIIPVVGLIVAVVAWRQIGDSNGTETGKPVAALGFLLSLLIGGSVVAREVIDHNHARSDGLQMASLATQLGEAIKAKKFEAAYNLFDVNFRSRVAPPQFQATWTGLQQPPYTPLQSLTWNGVNPQYEKLEGNDGLFGVIYVAVKFQSSEGRFTFVCRKVSDTWQINNIPELFPMERGAKK